MPIRSCVDLLLTKPLVYGYLGNHEMPHKAAFNQGLYCLLRLKQHSGTEMQRNLKNLPVTLRVYNGQFHTYCNNTCMYGNIHKTTTS